MKHKTLEQQVFFYQLIGITLAVILSLGLSLYLIIRNDIAAIDRNAFNVGALLANSPSVHRIVENQAPSEEYNQYLDYIVKDLKYIDVVTICDANSVRLYHTNKDMIGKKFVGGDEVPILQGAPPYVTDGTGTLGRQRRAFFPVTDADGNIGGFILVSVLTANVYRLIRQILVIFALLSLVLLLTGLILARTLNRKLLSVLLGYRPEELTRLYIEREEVLDALDEGIFAINNEGCLILINESARKMLNIPEKPKVGTKLTEVFPETRLLHVLETRSPEYNIDFFIHDLNIISSRIPILENGKLTGAVSIFRDKTEVTRLAEELTGAKYTVDTLRAFNHEFKNKLHVILGYIEMGEYQKVTELILNSSMASTKAVENVTKSIHIPALSALIIGKIIRASELGIRLQLKPDSFCHETQSHLPTDIYITILGNLIENAMEELNKNTGPLKEINVGIYIWPSGSILSVDDTAGGIPEELQPRIFEKGFSTKGQGRGTGLYLVHDIVERCHGTIELESSVGVGTSFTVTITSDDKKE